MRSQKSMSIIDLAHPSLTLLFLKGLAAVLTPTLIADCVPPAASKLQSTRCRPNMCRGACTRTPPGLLLGAALARAGARGFQSAVRAGQRRLR